MNSPEEVELCDHGVPLGDSIRIGCQLCWDSALDGAMRQAESGIAAHIEAGAPFETCKCIVCEALRERRIQSATALIRRMHKFLLDNPQEGFDKWRDAEDDVNTWLALNSKGEKPT